MADTETLTPSARSTEMEEPFPDPPGNELSNAIALKTLQDAPYLFAIVTPIKVDVLEYLLQTHPNRPLINSTIRGFRQGFWPYAVTEGIDIPDLSLIHI